jgi:hypothetical protein
MSTFKRYAIPSFTAIAVIAIAVFSWKYSSLPSGHEESVEEYRNVAKADIGEKLRISQERFEQVQSEWWSAYQKLSYSGEGPEKTMVERIFAKSALNTAESGLITVDQCFSLVQDHCESLDSSDLDSDSIPRHSLLVEDILGEADCLMETVSYAAAVVDGSSGAGHKAIRCHKSLLSRKAHSTVENSDSRIFCPWSEGARLEIMNGVRILLTVREVENEN